MKIKFIYIALFSFIALNGFAQKAGERKADKNYDKYAYIDAIKTYERIAEKGYKNPDMLQKIGNAYYFNADLVNAEKWYGELFAMSQEVEAEYYFRYAQSLKAVGNYTKADEMMTKFNEKSGNDKRGLLAKEQKAGHFTPRFKESAQPILVHGHCHQKAFAAVSPALELLRLIPNANPQLIESSCCGMAGSFGYEVEHIEASKQMAELSLLPTIRKQPNALVVADGTSCRHQIADGASREAMHIVRILESHLDSEDLTT